MNFNLSLDTLIISAVVAMVGWGLKETAKSLITTLLKTIAKVEVLDSKISDVLKQMSLFDKMRTDLNVYYDRLKVLEKKVGE